MKRRGSEGISAKCKTFPTSYIAAEGGESYTPASKGLFGIHVNTSPRVDGRQGARQVLHYLAMGKAWRAKAGWGQADYWSLLQFVHAQSGGASPGRQAGNVGPRRRTPRPEASA